ncbi:hypothetical protein HPB48_022345 [Haemaphysalis longicornis]|uniref:Egal-1 winged helix domain-containing protein n=1 Tax=Haemaphysalis longicornis TaxID=44386 RepID=A0A9J6FJ04_HAELO|nr:hypothetical protein HPB48_022345 [Haemaphysalis longicornis]
MSEPSGHSPDAVAKFLNALVEPHQAIPIQQLTGHLSQLPPELRTTYGCSLESVMGLSQPSPGVFAIRDNNVYVAAENRQATSSVNGSAESHCFSIGWWC